MSISQRLRELAWPVLGQPLQDLKIWLIKKSCVGHVDGIDICDASINAVRSSEIFLKSTHEALSLVRSLDSRRYRRICRHIKYIVNQDIVECGSYEKKLRMCNVDFSKFSDVINQEWKSRSYACVLVHESTHGVIAEKGILYDKDNRLHIERLCHLETYRFAQRFEPGFADSFIGPFDPELWNLAWGPQENRREALRKRLHEAWMAALFKRTK
jgi:hypothetical protein